MRFFLYLAIILVISVQPAFSDDTRINSYLEDPIGLLIDLVSDYRSLKLEDSNPHSTVGHKKDAQLYSRLVSALNVNDTQKIEALFFLNGSAFFTDQNESAIVQTFIDFYIYIRFSAPISDLYKRQKDETATTFRIRLKSKAFKKALTKFEQKFNIDRNLNLFEAPVIDVISSIPDKNMDDFFIGLLQGPMLSLATAYDRIKDHNDLLSPFLSGKTSVFLENKCVIFKMQKFQMWKS